MEQFLSDYPIVWWVAVIALGLVVRWWLSAPPAEGGE